MSSVFLSFYSYSYSNSYSQLEAIHLIFIFSRKSRENNIHKHLFSFPFLLYLTPFFVISQLVSKFVVSLEQVSFYEATKLGREKSVIRYGYIQKELDIRMRRKKKRESQIHKVNKMMNVSLFFSSLSLLQLLCLINLIC